MPATQILWTNVLALMNFHIGKKNLSAFAKSVGVGLGTIERIEQQKTSVGLRIVEKIAKRYKLEPWQLLVPGLDPKNPPMLQPMDRVERKVFDTAKELAKSIRELEGLDG